MASVASPIAGSTFAGGGAASAATLPVTTTATGCAASSGEGGGCFAVDESLAESAALLCWSSLLPGFLVAPGVTPFAGASPLALATVSNAATTAALLGVTESSLGAESGVAFAAVAAAFPAGAGPLFVEFVLVLLAVLAALASLVGAGACTVCAVRFAFAVPDPWLAKFCDVAIHLRAPSAVAVWTGVVPAAPAPGVALVAEARGADAASSGFWTGALLGAAPVSDAPVPGAALLANSAGAGPDVPVLAGAAELAGAADAGLAGLADIELLASWGAAALSAGRVS